MRCATRPIGFGIRSHRTSRHGEKGDRYRPRASSTRGSPRTPEAELNVIETAGGLLSPLGRALSNVDLARVAKPSAILLVSVDRLGVLHDVAVCVLALRVSGLMTPTVVLHRPDASDASTGSNAEELRSLHDLRVIELARGPACGNAETLVPFVRELFGQSSSSCSFDPSTLENDPSSRPLAEELGLVRHDDDRRAASSLLVDDVEQPLDALACRAPSSARRAGVGRVRGATHARGRRAGADPESTSASPEARTPRVRSAPATVTRPHPPRARGAARRARRSAGPSGPGT